jgi:hypothetical protein
MVILTAFLFVFGVATLRVFYRQFSEMQTQTVILNTQAQQAAADSIEAARRVESQLAIAENQARAAQLTANAAKSSADTALRQLNLSERPWIYSEFTPTRLIFKNDGGFLMLKIAVTNLGHSVAQSVTASTELWLDTRTVAAERKRFCAFPRQEMNDAILKDWGGSNLFPGEHRTFDQPAAANNERIGEALSKGDFKSLHMISIYLITCVDYISPIDAKHHQTQRIFGLERPDPITHGAMGTFDPHGTYEPSQFAMHSQDWDRAD